MRVFVATRDSFGYQNSLWRKGQEVIINDGEPIPPVANFRPLSETVEALEQAEVETKEDGHIKNANLESEGKDWRMVDAVSKSEAEITERHTGRVGRPKKKE